MDNNDRFRRPSDGRLPHNRKELFFNILRWRFTYLLAIGLLSLAFLLPDIAALTYNDIAASVISQSGEDVASKIVTLRLQTSVLQIICYIVLFFGASGVFYLLRQLAWDEPTSIFSGWWQGVKQNWKHYTFLGVCVGILNVLNTFAEVLLHGFVKYVPRALFVLVVVPVLLYAAILDVVYIKKLGNLLSGAATLYFKTLPITLLFALLVIAPTLLLFVPKFTIRYAILATWVVVVLPIVLYGWTLYAIDKLDKFINKEHYPEIYNKGVYVDKASSKEDTEE